MGRGVLAGRDLGAKHLDGRRVEQGVVVAKFVEQRHMARRRLGSQQLVGGRLGPQQLVEPLLAIDEMQGGRN